MSTDKTKLSNKNEEPKCKLDGFFISSNQNVVTVSQGEVRLSDTNNEVFKIDSNQEAPKLGLWNLDNETENQMAWKQFINIESDKNTRERDNIKTSRRSEERGSYPVAPFLKRIRLGNSYPI